MEKEARKIDLLAIGDIVIDTFIKLDDARVHCNINSENCELCLRFGDKVPYESVTVVPAGGNGPNAIVSAARLGLSTALITNLGDDQNGQDCIEKLKKEGVDTRFVKLEKNKLTNYHYVLWYETERTVLIRHQDYDRVWPTELEEIDPPTWVYFSSLGENSLPYHKKVIDYLNKYPEIKLAFQPGTFQMKFGPEKLKEVYARTDAFFCNKEEAGRILNAENKDLLELSKGISALGPKIVFISDGTNGSYLYQNEDLYFLPVFTDSKPAVERTGAGDAFSSAITSAMALGLSPLEAFKWGPINATSVVHYVGAQEGLLTREKLLEYLKNAPANYQPKKIN